MNTIIFDTANLGQKQFSSAWTYLTDQSSEPCHGKITIFDDHICCQSQERIFALNLLAEVTGFGKVIIRTTNIKAQNQSVDILDALIEGRFKQINNELQNIKTHLHEDIIAHRDILRLEPMSMNKLSRLMRLGEKLILEESNLQLQQKINNSDIRSVLFGGQAFGVDKGNVYTKLHEASFDLGVAPTYFFILKPKSRNETDWTRTDRVVDWLVKSKRIIKGHPLVWLHPKACPDWMKSLSFGELKAFIREHVSEVVNRYKNVITMWDIANEMNVDDANGFNLTVNQSLELVDIASKAVHKTQPEAHRIINFSDIWAAGSSVREKPSVPPVHFLKLCQDRNIEFEGVGLQFYMGMKKEFTCRELLNISQTLDTFLPFGKALHFSELGWPSKNDVDPTCFFASDHPEEGGWWHRRWDENLQAELLDNIFTVFLSKPNVKSITWWDFTDNGTNLDIGSRFLPFGGLTRRDFSPKPALHKLQNFRVLLKG